MNVPAHIIAIGAGLLACSCVSQRTGSYFTSGLRSYRGDGVIEDTSQRAILFGTRGYLVAMPRFQLDRPFDGTFRLGGLPIIEDKKTGVALIVPDTFSRERMPNTNSIIEYSVIDSQGKEITHVKSALGALIWSSPIHGHLGSALYQLDTSFFQPASGASYRLHVTYSPEPGAGAGEGYFYLWSSVGGS